MQDHDLYLGTSLADGARVTLDTDHLTTHAVCLGMTGSGKTGLGIVALEELARRGVPLLVIDLKGDMVNLLLNFPELAPDDFASWLPHDATGTAAELAAAWRGGLQSVGLGSEDLRAVRDGVSWQLLTPGAASGAPLDILPALGVPPGWDPAGDPDGASERVNGVTAGLLSLVGRGGDALADRDHVLTAAVILEHWRRGENLDLARLLASLSAPPMAALGALPVESFYPRPERMKLVMSLNTLLASPAFAAWTSGLPLDMEELLGRPGEPKASIVAVAHLDDRQRSFIIALLASELVAWMRRQPASSGLRALVYVDELQGLMPPHPANPPTKGPLLTLLKQGRAFGVGAWLATQNPVDLDYKALGNAGVKLVGRLLTARDRERALEGLGMRRLADGRDADAIVAGLGKREFLLSDVRAKDSAITFASRWAMSYLRGPLTLVEMAPLLRRGPAAEAAPGVAASAAAGGGAPPPLGVAVPVRFAAAGRGPAVLRVLVRAGVSVERAALDLRREREELWLAPVDDRGRIRWDEAEDLDAPPALAAEPPAEMSFPAAAPAELAAQLGKADAAFRSWRARQPVMVPVNEGLKLAAREGESHEAFLARCLEVADRADDATQERLRTRYEGRMATLRKRVARERDELDRDRSQLQARRAEEAMGAVEGLLSVLLGSRSVRSASHKAASKLRTAAGKRRMRQSAEGSVTESEREIERLELELGELAAELQAEIDRIAAASEEAAERIEEKPFKPKASDVAVLELALVWR
jgi:hypothetical protein